MSRFVSPAASLSSIEPLESRLTFAFVALISPIVNWSVTSSPAWMRISPSTLFSVALVAIVNEPVVASISIVPTPAVITSTFPCRSMLFFASSMMLPVLLVISALSVAVIDTALSVVPIASIRMLPVPFALTAIPFLPLAPAPVWSPSVRVILPFVVCSTMFPLLPVTRSA